MQDNDAEKPENARLRDKARRALKEIPIAPTLLTLGNFFCGFLAISYIADSFHSGDSLHSGRGNLLTYAAWLIFLGMIFDLFDGKVARLTRQESEFGVQMDSMADILTFGIAPAFLIKGILDAYWPEAGLKLTLLICAFYAGCAALRLARFNVETGLAEEDHQGFRGLPSPAAAGCLASLALLFLYHPDPKNFLQFIPEFTSDSIDIYSRHMYLAGLLAFTFLTGFLMISRVRYKHFGFLLFKEKKPFILLPLLLATVLIFIYARELCLVLALCSYALLGFIGALSRKFFRLFKPASTENKGADSLLDEDEIF